MSWVLKMTTCFSMCRKLILVCRRFLLDLGFLSVCGRWKLIRAVNTGNSRRAWRCSHLYWVLLLRLYFKILNLLHDHVRKSKLDNFLILRDCSHLVIIIVSCEEILYRLSSQSSKVLLELLILNVPPLLINIFLVEIILLWWYERWLKFPLF